MGGIGNGSIKFTLREVIKPKESISVCSHTVTSIRRFRHCQELELSAAAPVGVQRGQEVPRSRISSHPRRAACPDTTGRGWIPFLAVKRASTTREVHPKCGIPGLQITFC